MMNMIMMLSNYSTVSLIGNMKVIMMICGLEILLINLIFYAQVIKGGVAERGAVEIYDQEEIKTFGRPAHLSNGTSPAI